jgi:hypothetical protein
VEAIGEGILTVRSVKSTTETRRHGERFFLISSVARDPYYPEN